MKVIDLLNKIANGKIPKKIKHGKDIWVYKKINQEWHYVLNCSQSTMLSFEYFIKNNKLNDEVEIIEEDKEIEELEQKALKIFNHFGSDSQEDKLHEEVGEFLKAHILYRNGLDTREHVVEEFSDVELVMLQFKKTLKITDEEQMKENIFKADRTIKKNNII